MHSNAFLLSCAVLAVAVLVFLIIRLKISSFLALIMASVFLGLCAGMEPARFLESFQNGVGAVLGSIAMVIALGTILGKILGETGAADVIATHIARAFGTTRLSWAFLLIGFIVGLPVFFAVGLVLLIPILEATCREHRLSRLKLGLPMLAGLSAAHGLVPPHPGPIAAIGLMGADLGKTLLYSLPVGLVAAVIAGPLLVRLLPAGLLIAMPDEKTNRRMHYSPPFALGIAAILLPLGLMTLVSLADLFAPPGHWARAVVPLVGHPISALLLGVIFAAATLGRNARLGREDVLRMSEESLGPVALILLVIAAGAGFSRVLIDSGAGKAVADIAIAWNLPVLPMGFALASLIRIATGSATVAITTCAGLIKPLADARPGTNLELLVLAMGAGSLILSHVNDGGFWLVKGYMNLSVPQTLKTWTLLETILALAAFGTILLLAA
jgi:GntP family gluconate:H+ symporter